MPELVFTAVMRIRDGNPYLAVSASRARAIKPDWRRPLPVLVQINGKPAKPWRITFNGLRKGATHHQTGLVLQNVRRLSGFV